MNTKIFTLTAMLVLPATAFAQASADTDGDGMVSVEEFAAAYPDVAPDLFATLDTDESGTLDETELTAAQEAGLVPMDDM